MESNIVSDVARITLCYALPSLILVVLVMGIYGSIVINKIKKNKEADKS